MVKQRLFSQSDSPLCRRSAMSLFVTESNTTQFFFCASQTLSTSLFLVLSSTISLSFILSLFIRGPSYSDGILLWILCFESVMCWKFATTAHFELPFFMKPFFPTLRILYLVFVVLFILLFRYKLYTMNSYCALCSQLLKRGKKENDISSKSCKSNDGSALTSKMSLSLQECEGYI